MCWQRRSLPAVRCQRPIPIGYHRARLFSVVEKRCARSVTPTPAAVLGPEASVDHKLIAVLSDGDFHSGEDLGRLLGVSRAAVWKQLQKLSALDIPVESVRGRGYRIPGGLELLVREAVA